MFLIVFIIQLKRNIVHKVGEYANTYFQILSNKITILNLVWTILVSAGIVFCAIQSPQAVLPVMIDSCQGAFDLTISFVAVYCVWLGFFNVLQSCGALKGLSKLLNPTINFLYGDVSEPVKEYLLLNMSANLLGLGNAATPSAVKAVSILERNTKGKCTFATTMLFVLNATSLQLLPTTVIGMRAQAGSINSADIILPTIVSSAITTVFGVLLVHCFVKK